VPIRPNQSIFHFFQHVTSRCRVPLSVTCSLLRLLVVGVFCLGAITESFLLSFGSPSLVRLDPSKRSQMLIPSGVSAPSFFFHTAPPFTPLKNVEYRYHPRPVLSKFSFFRKYPSGFHSKCRVRIESLECPKIPFWSPHFFPVECLRDGLLADLSEGCISLFFALIGIALVLVGIPPSNRRQTCPKAGRIKISPQGSPT